MNKIKKLFIFGFFLSMVSIVFAQKNLSVPLSDPVYNILEYAQIRNYCKNLHNSRPYTLSLILESLNQILEHPLPSLSEKQIIQETIERLSPPPTQFAANAGFWKNTGKIFQRGFYRYEKTDGKIPISVQVGAALELNLASNFNDPSFSHFHWLDLHLLGDVGSHFSYNLSGGLGPMKLTYSAYAPNTFTQSWDGYQILMDQLGEFAGKSEAFAAGFRLLPEFGFSFWNNKLGVNFSRIKRDWGTGMGNLLLSKTAHPFIAFDMFLHPIDWFSLSFLAGSLEYFRSDGIKSSAAIFQNAYTAFMLEIFIKDWIYLGANSTAVWLKRFELSYTNPGMVPLLSQHTLGDFDNVQMGFSLGFNVPKYAKFYFNLFIDELDPSGTDFFHQAGTSMLAWQGGTKISLPNTPLVTFNIQYTKLEPFMYTHPLTEVPWYSNKMDTSYINHGDPLGYKLEPNSAELLLNANIMPFWFFNANIFYSLVQHGASYGSGRVPGSSYTDKMVYAVGASSAKPGDYYYKDFLKDGVYEWTHSLGLQASLDLRFVKEIPLKISLGYTLTYTHHTEFIDGKLKQPQSTDYKNRFGNYLTLSIKIY